MKLRLLLILPLGMALLSSCHLSNPNAVAEKEIRDILYDLSRDFNWKNIGGIMQSVHPDYLHNGMYDNGLRELWLGRMALYDLLTIEVQFIDFSTDYATVHMRLVFESAAWELTLVEPGDSGDVSYFYYSNGSWKIHGNQLWGW